MENNALTDRFDVLRFHEGDQDFFQCLTIWTVRPDLTKHKLIFSSPRDLESPLYPDDHLFQSLNDLKEPFFHFTTISPPDGVKIIYSLIVYLDHPVKMSKIDGFRIIKANTIVLISLISKFFHPQLFRTTLLTHYNNLPNIISMTDENLIESSINLEMTPFDLSPSTELGSLTHYAFSTLHLSQVLMVTRMLLSSTSVIVTSAFPRHIAPFCFSLLSLIYPIQWTNVFIASVPDRYIELLESPVAYIAGLTLSTLSLIDIHDYKHCVFLNIDHAHMYCETQDIVPEITGLTTFVMEQIGRDLAMHANSGIFPASRIRKRLWLYMLGILCTSAQMTEEEISQKDSLKILAQKLTQRREYKGYMKMLSESSVVVHFTDMVLHGSFKTFTRLQRLMSKMGPVYAHAKRIGNDILNR